MARAYNNPRTYIANAVEPFSGDDTPNLDDMFKECKQGLKDHEHRLQRARDEQDFYNGNSAKFIPLKPSEDYVQWIQRPKRESFITKKAVNKLTSHLYKPGPSKRKLSVDYPDVDAWYTRVTQDIHLNGVMQQADRLATLHGLCAIGIYPTGDARMPINYHLFNRPEFVYWTSSDDPRVWVAFATNTKKGTDTVRYRLWTKTAYYTFYKGKDWGYEPGGWNVARYDPETSGPHPYGVIPFVPITNELPTTELETQGLGSLLAKVNLALNIDKSNLALWVHIYGRPLGFVSGVGPDWKPRFIDGGFVPLVVKHDSTEDAPVMPEARYLESNIDIAALTEWVRGEANQALDELDIPLTLATQSDGAGGSMARSGVAVIANESDLITYAKNRQELFNVHESNLVSLICKIGASEPAGLYSLRGELEAVAADPSLRVSWPITQIDMPGPDRDLADQWELDNGITSQIQVLQKRYGLEDAEAIEAFREVKRMELIAQQLAADPEATIETPGGDEDTDALAIESIADDVEATRQSGVDQGDMGVAPAEIPENATPKDTPSITMGVATVLPQTPLAEVDPGVRIIGGNRSGVGYGDRQN